MRLAFLTVASKEYYPRFCVLRDSITMFHPEADTILLALDDIEDNDVVIWKPKDLKLNYVDLKLKYELVDFQAALRPAMMLKAFELGYDVVLMVGSDCEFYSRIDAALELLKTYTVVVTPHITRPLPQDEFVPSNESLGLTGHLNGDFLLFKKSSESIGFLRWMDEVLALKGYRRPELGIFSDQTWIAYLPSFIDDVKVLRHSGYNLSFWNIHQRDLHFLDGWYTADGPLVMAHFSEIDAVRPLDLVKHNGRYENISDNVKDFYVQYINKIVQYGHDSSSKTLKKKIRFFEKTKKSIGKRLMSLASLFE